MANFTEPQRAALKWLRERGGSGVFGSRGGVPLAAGDWAPFMRSTLNVLRDWGLVDIHGRRVQVTDDGTKLDCGKTQPRREINELGGKV